MVAYSFKRRFVVPIRLGLGLPYALDDIEGDIEVASRPKRQTIRAEGLRRHVRPDETLQLYCGMRSSGCFLIGTAKCQLVWPIDIQFEKRGRRGDRIIIPGNRIDHIGGLDEFAYHDGFASWDEMLAFWQKEHPKVTDFSGFLIRWKPA